MFLQISLSAEICEHPVAEIPEDSVVVVSNIGNGRDILKSSVGRITTNPGEVLDLVISVVSVTPAVITSLEINVENAASIIVSYVDVAGQQQVWTQCFS